jgi:SAM-dependent methyltransferase
VDSHRYDVYDEFAWFYTRGWALDFHNQARPVLEARVFARLKPGARVLDLCCGAGNLSEELAARGFLVTGLDGSEEMLRYARRRVPEAEFRTGDARSFSLEPVFDAVVSTFDSLNHVLKVEELNCVFANAFGALAAGGLFAFDLNMQEAFETLWHGVFASIDDETAGITRGSYDREMKTGRADVSLFRKLEDGGWRRSDVSVLERCYSREEIVRGLAAAGFTSIEVREAWELGMRGDVALGREWFFASKP